MGGPSPVWLGWHQAEPPPPCAGCQRAGRSSPHLPLAGASEDPVNIQLSRCSVGWGLLAVPIMSRSRMLLTPGAGVAWPVLVGPFLVMGEEAAHSKLCPWGCVELVCHGSKLCGSWVVISGFSLSINIVLMVSKTKLGYQRAVFLVVAAAPPQRSGFYKVKHTHVARYEKRLGWISCCTEN